MMLAPTLPIVTGRGPLLSGLGGRSLESGGRDLAFEVGARIGLNFFF